MPNTTRRIIELPITDAPLGAKKAVVLDETGGQSNQVSAQALADAGLRLLKLPHQLQRVDPGTGALVGDAPSDPAANLGPLNALDNVLATDGIPVVRRTGTPAPYAEQVKPDRLIAALPPATPFTAGVMSAADKANLDNIVGGGGVSVLPSSIPLGRAMTGPATFTLLDTDKGTLAQVDATAGTVIVDVLAGIATSAGSVLAGAFRKNGAGTLRITASGTPSTTPTTIASDYFGYGRNSDNAGTFMAAQTITKTSVVSTGGSNCAIYIWNATTPGVTGNTAGTIGLSIAGVAKAWDRTDRSTATVEPISPAMFFAAKALGTVADGASITVAIDVSGSHWRSGALLVAIVKDVPQDNLFNADTIELFTSQTAAASKLIDIVVSAGNRRLLYAGFCRSGTNGSSLPTVTGATLLEAGVNDPSAVVTSNVRALLAEEAGAVGTNDATVTFPSSQLYGWGVVSIPPFTTGGMTLIMPNNGSADLTGVNQIYGWLYDNNAGTFQIV